MEWKPVTERLRNIPDEIKLQQLATFRENPWFGEMVRFLEDQEIEVTTAIVDTFFAGLHDVFNQQQLIGETRGLRRFKSELQSRQEELIAQIENKQDGNEPASSIDTRSVSDSLAGPSGI